MTTMNQMQIASLANSATTMLAKHQATSHSAPGSSADRIDELMDLIVRSMAGGMFGGMFGRGGIPAGTHMITPGMDFEIKRPGAGPNDPPLYSSTNDPNAPRITIRSMTPVNMQPGQGLMVPSHPSMGSGPQVVYGNPETGITGYATGGPPGGGFGGGTMPPYGGGSGFGGAPSTVGHGTVPTFR